ncbi:MULTISPECIES: TetR/AcrR family transcriptional regulator [Pseudomonas]|jgi:AcrR family transcriptional regulator|uniref:TetR/AcrR family transcriptional regulator n=1 Tax=Pseudomonas TaxID=286 RepID=UPI000492FF81|nr:MULTISPECIES: TetR/AcrR family transcriptional regulator [Pseudomonas]MBC3337460.1 TetR/AcrR family transcriptional regulator [Pseudomonas proteolytica]NMY96594.1 TetR/AcrR family transcriptional regulator [Pseudomonas proteolytica]NMZ01869.1 TetR/AcrR family transcriptional regulator [Pseudomonas proteolytica]QJI17733.1 TetR/AcrR family transcriptional regulator [Pseudomonas sp. ADAK21]QJI22104.1 TetR/AcrR family transcriptional regulator [Pseudomonas sp. ADAK20]
MARRTRAEMEETRATLLVTARKVFSDRGYADTSMDDLTAQANLTRGALYHHFGDKKGLLAAAVEQIDAEMDQRLQAISNAADDEWEGFRSRCRAYLEMALEPEIQRIVLRDARAVLGGASPDSQRHCVESMRRLIDSLMQSGIVAPADPQALASMIYGSLAEAAFWIAEGEDGNTRLAQGVVALELLLRGMLIKQ